MITIYIFQTSEGRQQFFMWYAHSLEELHHASIFHIDPMMTWYESQLALCGGIYGLPMNSLTEGQ